MSQLNTLQQYFQHYLICDDPSIEPLVVNTNKVPSKVRLGVYQNAYEARLVEALASSYPSIQEFLGYDLFLETSLDYIKKHPSTYRSIRWFGDQFPDHLAKNPVKDFPYLSELAEFEWKMSLCFDAADQDCFTLEQMAAIPMEAWAEMRLILHPSVIRMNCYWSVVSLWQQITSESELQPPTKTEKPSYWVLYRKDYMNHFYTVEEPEASALDAALKGANFSELCEGLCEWYEEDNVAMQAAIFLKGWINSGLLCGIDQRL